MTGIGIIGYGGFGRFLHGAWGAMDGVEVRAVADARADAAPEGVTFYTDWRRLLKHEGVDLVSVATPPWLHAEMAVAALEAGRHVLVEKPTALTREDARRIRRAAEASGRVATVDYMLRFNPIVEALHAWARSGAFGRLQRVVVENYAQDEALPPGHWFWDRERSGGILVEHAVHFIDLVSACTDAPVRSVDGLALPRRPEQQDRVLATVTYEDGLLATHYHAFSRPGFFEHTSMRFVFDLAQVEVEGWIPLRGRVTALVQDGAGEALARLPGLEVERRPAGAVPDRSRPDGGGPKGEGAVEVRSGGRVYRVVEHVEGRFALAVPKHRAYADALRALLADLVRATRDPSHSLRVTLDEGLASLDVALRAAESTSR